MDFFLFISIFFFLDQETIYQSSHKSTTSCKHPALKREAAPLFPTGIKYDS